MPQEHAPLGQPYVHGYDQGDSSYPIVAIGKDPRAQGYSIPADLSAPNGQIINLDITSHRFVGVTPALDDRRVLWEYRILPGPVVHTDLHDDARGAVQVSSRTVAATGGEAGTLVTVANAIFASVITTAGGPYANPPAVTISDDAGGPGDGALAEAVMDRGTVAGLRIIAPGANYSAPLAIIAPQAGAVTATATISTTPTLALWTQYQPVEGNRTMLQKIVQTWPVPGDVVLGSEIDHETGIVVTTATREVAAGTRAGIDSPASTNVTLWTIAANTVGTVASAAGLRVGMDVTIAGDARTTPSVNGTRRITAIAGTLIALDFQVTALAGTGSYGTMVLSAHVYREIQKKSRATSIEIASQVDIASLAGATKIFYMNVDHDWSQRLVAVTGFRDTSTGSTTPSGVFPDPTTLQLMRSSDESVSPSIKMARWGGESAARITKSYSVTAPAGVAPQTLVLSTGEIVSHAYRIHESLGIIIDAGGAITGLVIGTNKDYRQSVATVPYCLTGGVTAAYSGAGSATIDLNITASNPATLDSGTPYNWKASDKVQPGALGLYERILIELTPPAF